MGDAGPGGAEGAGRPFRRVFSGAPWEEAVGYCRVLEADGRLFVTGTAPVTRDGKGVYAPGDAYAQTVRCLEIIRESLAKLGVGLDRVARTRMFVTDISRWEEYGRAHAEAFRGHPPATTMVEVRALIRPGMLIEIEADAVR
ncbi:MAG: RidA family protein [Longimicrobiales bacterium]|nr:RidA family protein [Longimicrobiales bacterium]